MFLRQVSNFFVNIFSIVKLKISSYLHSKDARPGNLTRLLPSPTPLWGIETCLVGFDHSLSQPAGYNPNVQSL